jgi:hypothetical protein
MLWLLLFLGVIGAVVYFVDKKIKAKFEDKFNPNDWELPRSVELPISSQPQLAAPIAVAKINYEKKPSVFAAKQLAIFNALQGAVYGEYILLANINAADVLAINAGGNVLAEQVAIKNIANHQFDFLVCDKNQLRAVCAIALGDSLVPLLVTACEAAQLPLARFRIQPTYDVAVIRESLFRAIGVVDTTRATIPATTLATTKESALDIVDEQPSKPVLTESAIQLELCPHCSSVMLKRKATNGAAAGKLFWACSNYPKCRGVVPVK